MRFKQRSQIIRTDGNASKTIPIHSSAQRKVVMMDLPVVADANPQSASPLFTCLPAELRNYIFELALTAYDDKTRPYSKRACFYRPTYRYAKKIDTNLLLTCRRTLSETKDLPASSNELTLWFWRGPPGSSKTELLADDATGDLTRRRGLKIIHLFTQQNWLEGAKGGFERFTTRWKDDCPKHLIITIRHCDWWW